VIAFSALPIPSILPMLIAVCGWSPVIIFTRIPACRQSPIAVIASGRGGSIIPATPSRMTPCCKSSWLSSVCPSAAGFHAAATIRSPSRAYSSIFASQ